MAATLSALFKERILVLDGAMGTMIQEHDLGEEEQKECGTSEHGRPRVQYT